MRSFAPALVRGERRVLAICAERMPLVDVGPERFAAPGIVIAQLPVECLIHPLKRAGSRRCTTSSTPRDEPASAFCQNGCSVAAKTETAVDDARLAVLESQDVALAAVEHRDLPLHVRRRPMCDRDVEAARALRADASGRPERADHLIELRRLRRQAAAGAQRPRPADQPRPQQPRRRDRSNT